MTHAERQAAQMWQDIMTYSRTVENRMIECVDALEKRGYDVSEARQLIPAGWEAYNSGDYWALQKVIAMIWEALRRAPEWQATTISPTHGKNSREAGLLWSKPELAAWMKEIGPTVTKYMARGTASA